MSTKSLFASSPESRHDYTSPDGRSAASSEADRFMAQFFNIMEDGEHDTQPFANKLHNITRAIDILEKRRARLIAERDKAMEPYRQRANARLRQIIQHRSRINESVHKPSAVIAFPSGQVRVTQKGGGSRVSWEANDDILAALWASSLPLEMLDECVRTTHEPNRAWLGEHLEDREEGQFLRWTDADGVVQECEVAIERPAPGGGLTHDPIRRSVSAPPAVRVQVRRTSDDEWREIDLAQGAAREGEEAEDNE